MSKKEKSAENGKKRNYEYALITGASSGIGAEFARQLALQGYQPILVARRKEKLIEIAREIEEDYKVNCIVFPADLSRPMECDRIYRYIKPLKLGVIINNAGFGDCGYFMNTDLEKEIAMVDLNVRSLHIMTKLALKKLTDQKQGYLLNVASSAGLLPAGPYMATYYATKSYVTSLTRALAQELKEQGSKVYIGALCPGPVDTEFNDVANVEFALKGISPEACVKAAIHGMVKRQTVIVPSLKMKLATSASRLLPDRILIPMTGEQQKKKLNQK